LSAAIRVADEAWIATALLHREHPEREDFTVHEIVERARVEGISEPLRPGVEKHVQYHSVADREPKPASLRMLTQTRSGMRRLYREGDPTHPQRLGKKMLPEADAIPEEYRSLLDWYRNEYARPPREAWLRGAFEMIGAGQDVLRGVDADRHVRELREGWE